jgi:hypothetical protein
MRPMFAMQVGEECWETLIFLSFTLKCAILCVNISFIVCFYPLRPIWYVCMYVCMYRGKWNITPIVALWTR